MRKRRVVILGATGSIGQSALKVARDIPERMEIVGMSAHRNGDALAAAAKDFPRARCVRTDGPDGMDRLIGLATLPGADLVLVAIVGTAGLQPALAAIEAGKDLAVASKEILVMAGEAVTQAAAKAGVRILPVDSEHNAIFQCLEGRDISTVKRLILTCSGGPFRHTPREEFEAITPEHALRHPTWRMGKKITVDSATLFNKALEMIEARWLFGLPIGQVEVIVHPQSIIHSMVEFVDGSTLAQLSHSDMGFPIHYAVTWPDRVPNSLRPLDFAQLARLDFEAARRDDFPALDLALEAGTRGGTLPAVMNAANEIAVEAFLAGKIRFPKIWGIVAKVMAECPHADRPDLEQVIQTDGTARALASRLALE
ncbi:MAG: 1-deoxy-D-xylulose-5-phosphate reductoisomerase [Terrimicrobiaceae bacterium]|jgi:1-deoxy-D-xylulose-5-phosphate reductoisomerase